MGEKKISSLGVLEEKAYAFALRILKAHKYLSNKNEYILSKQLVRSGTSIGANCREATYAQSKLDFINKLSIALKETNETIYWLELLHDVEYIPDEGFKSIHDDSLEIMRLLISIIKSTKSSLKNVDINC